MNGWCRFRVRIFRPSICCGVKCFALFTVAFISIATLMSKPTESNLNPRDVISVRKEELHPNDSAVYTSNTLVPFDYSYKINLEHMCDKDPVLVIMVCTAVINLQERQAIRDTWGSKKELARHNAVLIFLLGQHHLKFLEVIIKNESSIYLDIVQTNFLDTYNNLTMKSTALLHWVKTYCSSAEFVLKADDDVYVNPKVVIEVLRLEKRNKFMAGRTQKPFPVIRLPNTGEELKWVISRKEFPDDMYPWYLQGQAYAMPGAVVPMLYNAALKIPYFRIEDVFITGLCAKLASIPLRNRNKYFLASNKPCEIASLAVSYHKLSASNMYYIHKILTNFNAYCTKKTTPGLS